MSHRHKPLRAGKHALSPEQVAADQRRRIFEALVSVVAERGYAAATIVEVAERARVSRISIQQLLGVAQKERCFLWAYDAIVRRAIDNANTAYRSESEWSTQIRLGFTSFIQEVLDSPDAARLALVEVYAAGPAALDRMDRTTRAFEDILRASFANSSEEVALPPLIAKGTIGGISRVVRQRLIENRVAELPGLIDELLHWLLTYHSPAGTEIGFRRAPDPTPTRTESGRRRPTDERGRLIRAAASQAARNGYAKISPETIAREADVTRAEFEASFPGGVPDCFFAGFSELGADVIAGARAAARAQPARWPQRVHAGLESILWRIARDPTFARIAFVEVFAAGPAGIVGRRTLMHRFSQLLLSDVPAEHAPTEVVAEAIVGGVWQLAHDAVWSGTTARLPALADYTAYLVLAPLIGGPAALQEIRARP